MIFSHNDRGRLFSSPCPHNDDVTWRWCWWVTSVSVTKWFLMWLLFVWCIYTGQSRVHSQLGLTNKSGFSSESPIYSFFARPSRDRCCNYSQIRQQWWRTHDATKSPGFRGTNKLSQLPSWENPGGLVVNPSALTRTTSVRPSLQGKRCRVIISVTSATKEITIS